MPIALVDISHTYNDGTAGLRSVSISIEPGTLTAFVGPSGSGKTTLLSILGLLLIPTRGTVSYNGADVLARRLAAFRWKFNIAWVFQTANMLPRRTALDNVMLASLARGQQSEAARDGAVQALGNVGLSSKADVPVRQLSGGEVQRVGIARALSTTPHYLFADEPTGQLDRASTSGVLDSFRSLVDRGSTAVLATHDPFVASACHQVIRLVDGALIL